jgi:hypothetical protein
MGTRGLGSGEAKTGVVRILVNACGEYQGRDSGKIE